MFNSTQSQYTWAQQVARDLQTVSKGSRAASDDTRLKASGPVTRHFVAFETTYSSAPLLTGLPATVLHLLGLEEVAGS